MNLTEWHSGYRAYRVDALKDVPFESNSDNFDFDTEIILQMHEAGKSILEVPIPTYYGDEICYVNGMGYAKDVVKDVIRYRLHKMGFGSGEMAFSDEGYELKMSNPDSSHRKLIDWVDDHEPERVLDLGCSNGRLGELLRLSGHTVIGVTPARSTASPIASTTFEADLNQGVPAEVGTGFDVVLAADVLEHLVDPASMLRQIRDVLAPRGVVLLSVPNISHWYPRLRVVTGKFDYERRGIFDSGHVRFFTSKSLERTAAASGLRVRNRSISGVPIEAADRGGPAPRWLTSLLSTIDRTGMAIAPNLFAYQLLYELEPVS